MIVEARSRGTVVEDWELIRNGFLDRMRQGFGDHLTPAQIERLSPVDMEQLLLSIPGVTVQYDFGNSRVLLRGRGRRCTPSVYVNGMRMQTTGRTYELGVNVGDVKAVEVYQSAAEAPIRYGGSLMGGCGVLIIWTK